MAQFRETMWFKMGEHVEPEVDGDEPSNVTRPIEDRYVGKPSAEETATFGLHTGKTEAIRVDKTIASDVLPMTKLVREMKRRTSRVWIAGACVALAAVASALSVYV